MTNIYPSCQDAAEGTFIEQQIKGLTAIGVEVDVLVVNRRRQGMSVYLGLGSTVCSRISSFRPDLVHVLYGGLMADEVTRVVRDVPTIVSFCGTDLLGEHFARPPRRLIARFSVLASWRAARRSHGIVVKSRNLLDALPFFVDRSKIRIIPNGIDCQRFRPLDRDACRTELGWSDTVFHVLFCYNNSDPVKRPGLARNSVDEFNRLGIRAELQYLRRVPHDKVPVWLNAGDVLLVTSSQEGSPNIVKEALACDLPVVSVDVGDVSERLHGIEGCYLASPEPNDIAAKLNLVRARANRVTGRISIKELSLEKTALRLLDFYEEILARWSLEIRRPTPIYHHSSYW